MEELVKTWTVRSPCKVDVLTAVRRKWKSSLKHGQFDLQSYLLLAHLTLHSLTCPDWSGDIRSTCPQTSENACEQYQSSSHQTSPVTIIIDGRLDPWPPACTEIV